MPWAFCERLIAVGLLQRACCGGLFANDLLPFSRRANRGGLIAVVFLRRAYCERPIAVGLLRRACCCATTLQQGPARVWRPDAPACRGGGLLLLICGLLVCLPPYARTGAPASYCVLLRLIASYCGLLRVHTRRGGAPGCRPPCARTGAPAATTPSRPRGT